MSPSTPNQAVSEAARREKEILDRLKTALKDKRLVLIVGAGVALSATGDVWGRPLQRLMWTGLIRNGLDYLVNGGYVDTLNCRTMRAYDALEDPDSDSSLDAANIMLVQMKQNGQFPTWLESVFGSLYREVRHHSLLEALQALHQKGATLLTTNYDDLLEKVCGLRRIGRSNQDEIRKFKRGDIDGVFHVHGSYHDPHEVVLDTTDYYQATHSDEVQNVLKTFLEYKTILFISCGSGLEDPNFSSLLKWASERQENMNIPNRHCLLVQDGDSLNHRMLVRLKYGHGYKDLTPYLKRLLDDTSTASSADQPVYMASMALSSYHRLPKSMLISLNNRFELDSIPGCSKWLNRPKRHVTRANRLSLPVFFKEEGMFPAVTYSVLKAALLESASDNSRSQEQPHQLTLKSIAESMTPCVLRGYSRYTVTDSGFDKETMCYTGSPSDEIYGMLVLGLDEYCRQALDEYQNGRDTLSIGQVKIRSREGLDIELEAGIYVWHTLLKDKDQRPPNPPLSEIQQRYWYKYWMSDSLEEEERALPEVAVNSNYGLWTPWT